MLALENIPELKPTHSQIQKQVSELLKYGGWFVYPNRQDELSYAGISDITALKDGRTIWIEIKTEKDKQKPKQIEFQKRVEQAGGEYLVAHSIDDVSHLVDGLIRW